ncbi:hypothetical protein Bca52824_079246 [Brassica carinata]|uniref:Alpha-ketoglutarate-dependent dioxygenase AlkB-like domain-containing protein n=1 Tax=Brassica carinata TaxID=52824 RepID=A0A8X7TZ55_BRACI|nr:hypothetical protein Bca52824_079246 [Brassica carinata]
MSYFPVKEDPPHAMYLRSGDVVLMAGGARECFHAKPYFICNHQLTSFFFYSFTRKNLQFLLFSPPVWSVMISVDPVGQEILRSSPLLLLPIL